ncbi:MAG: carboxypeptidase-like regulatory domain-containing protein [Pirellulaceae bacterium]|nr:carboxypeptidase-like regulatory domain-containing protein [Pirellulaceae bacterium]
MLRYAFLAQIFSVTTVALLGGCSGGGLAPVQGTVTFADGRPAQNITVTFQEREKQVGASGTTDASGIYRLSSQSPGDGAPPGNYLVSVHQPGPADSNDPEPPRLFPKRYENAQTSGLSCEVKPGPNEFNITLEAK